MTLQGYPTLVTFKDSYDPNKLPRYDKGVLLELKEKNERLKLSIRLEENGDIIQTLGGYYLDDCTYLEESSIEGVIMCFRHNETKEVVTITDKNKKCGRLFDKMVEYFENNQRTRNIPSPSPRRRSPSPKPKPQPKPNLPEDKKANNDVNKLVNALNESNANEAAKYARQLAQNNQSVQFALNLTNESGDTQAPKKKPEPVVEPIKLKVSIESFLIESADEQQYEVAVLPKTTIRDLKKIISDNAGVPFHQQFWYHGRELLGEDYEFGKPISSIVDDTLLILYISAPINA